MKSDPHLRDRVGRALEREADSIDAAASLRAFAGGPVPSPATGHAAVERPAPRIRRVLLVAAAALLLAAGGLVLATRGGSHPPGDVAAGGGDTVPVEPTVLSDGTKVYAISSLPTGSLRELPTPVRIGSVTLTRMWPGLVAGPVGPLVGPHGAGTISTVTFGAGVDTSDIDPHRTDPSGPSPSSAPGTSPIVTVLTVAVTDGLSPSEAARSMQQVPGTVERFRVGDVEVRVGTHDLGLGPQARSPEWRSAEAVLPSGAVIEVNAPDASPEDLLTVIASLL